MLPSLILYFFMNDQPPLFMNGCTFRHLMQYMCLMWPRGLFFLRGTVIACPQIMHVYFSMQNLLVLVTAFRLAFRLFLNDLLEEPHDV